MPFIQSTRPRRAEPSRTESPPEVFVSFLSGDLQPRAAFPRASFSHPSTSPLFPLQPALERSSQIDAMNNYSHDEQALQRDAAAVLQTQSGLQSVVHERYPPLPPPHHLATPISRSFQAYPGLNDEFRGPVAASSMIMIILKVMRSSG